MTAGRPQFPRRAGPRGAAMALAACAAAFAAAVIGAATAGYAAAAPAGPGPAPGSAAPGFDLPGTPARVRLDAYRGKLVYVDFWASWCGPCRKSFPWMSALQQRHGAAGLQVLAVNLDASQEDAAAFLAQQPAGFAVAFDPSGATARAYGVIGMPSSALVGRDGRLLWLHTGFKDGDQARLEERIKAALQPP